LGEKGKSCCSPSTVTRGKGKREGEGVSVNVSMLRNYAGRKRKGKNRPINYDTALGDTIPERTKRGRKRASGGRIGLIVQYCLQEKGEKGNSRSPPSFSSKGSGEN